MAKLTQPQRTLLRELDAGGPAHVSDTYKPAQALVTVGYAEFTRGKYSDLLSITDTGRAALAAHSAGAQGGKGE